MGHVMSQAVVNDSLIEEVEFSSIFLTEDEVSNANDIKLVDGKWVYEVNRIIPLTSEEWEHLALEILMKENIGEQEAPEAPVENNTTVDEQEAVQENAPEVEQVEVVQEAETPREVKQSASAKAIPEYSFIHGFKDLFFPAY